MDALKSSNIFLMLFAFSLVWTLSFATVFKAVCIKEPAVLSCSVQDTSAKDVTWKYQEPSDTNWHIIWDTSENKVNRNAPPKFKNVEVAVVNGSLTISPFSPKLSGVYSCKWDNEGQLVQDLHTVVAVSCEKTVCEGDNAIIPCETLKYKTLIFHRHNLKEFLWKKENENLVFSGHDMETPYGNPKYRGIGLTTQGALTIKSVSKDWNGQQLTCVVHEGNGSTPKRYSVTVKVQTCQTMIRVCQGKSIDLECPYYRWMMDSTEDIRLEWYYRNATKIATLTKGRTMMIHSHLVKVKGAMITLVSPGLLDSGHYRCKVFNQELLLAEHSVTLNVTNCHTPGIRNMSKRGDENTRESKPKPEAGGAGGHEVENEDMDSARAERILDIVIVVLFCLFVVFGLPILLYRMVKKRRSAEQPQRVEL